MKKKVADLVCLVGGVFITMYFLFAFDYGGGGLGDGYYYYYSGFSRFGLAVGASLICLGLLRQCKHKQ